MLNFFKKPFGCAVFIFLFGWMCRYLIKLMHLPVFDYGITELIFPVLESFVYTVWIYKEKMSSKMALKVALYTIIISLIGILFFVFMAKNNMDASLLKCKFIDADTIENLNAIFKTCNTGQIMFISYVVLAFTYLIFSPISIGINFLTLRIGNILGRSFMKDKWTLD